MAELLADSIDPPSVIESIETAEGIENYAATTRGASILVMQTLDDGRIIHVVWGLGLRERARVVAITAYIPDPNRWSTDFRRRPL